MRADGNSSVARRRAMMEDARMNPRKARKLYEEEDEEIEIEADAVEFDEGSEGDIESQTLNLIKAMQADGMLSNVTIEGEDEEEDFEEEELDESVKSRSQRIAEAKARIARRRVMESRKNRLAGARNPNPTNSKVRDILNKRIAEARLNKKEAPVSGSTARRIAEAKARIARRRVMESRKLRNR